MGAKIESPIIEWSSSNTDIITVNNQGLASAVGFGAATIFASIDNDNPKKQGEKITKAIATINVVEFKEGEIINKREDRDFEIGDTFDYNILSTNTVNSVWTSSDTNVAKVDRTSGLVTAISEGMATISVTTNIEGSIVTDETKVTVIKKQNITATLIGPSYGLSGTATLTSTALNFGDDFTVGRSPDGYFYLSNNPRSIANAIRVGPRVSPRRGAWSIPLNNINPNDYSHIIFWCDAANIYLGGGTF